MTMEQSEVNVLHICNDYSFSKVHSNLYKELDIKNLTQIIFNPLRNKSHIGNNVFSFKSTNSKIVYSSLMPRYIRFFYNNKIHFLYKSLIAQVSLPGVCVVHATTLFSDGGLAYKVFKQYSIPYIVSIRNTDINIFLKYRPDLYPLGLKILKNASKIIFLTPALKYLFFKNVFFRNYFDILRDKIEVIYNGIDDFWLNNNSLNFSKSQTRKFLYIGRFDSNKNIISLIKALDIARKNEEDIKLTLVGGGGNNHKKTLKLIRRLPWVRYLGPIYDKNILLNEFRENDFFAMPSIHETFGLVYLEALSQGLPILFSENQGVDGVFKYPVGVKTKPKNKYVIAKNILTLIRKGTAFRKNIEKIDFNMFSWSFIAEKHFHNYNYVLNRNNDIK